MNDREVVLVTGSSGLIGTACIERLGSRFDVVGFDSGGPPYPPVMAECVCVDLTSDESLATGMRRVRFAHGGRIAAVIHLAAYYDFSGAPSPKYEEVTVRGTERLLRELQAFDVGQLIFSSTMLVHAPCRPGEFLHEESPDDPRWPYPESKLETEKLLRARRGSIPIVILRIAGVYDETHPSVPIAHQMQRIFERQVTSHFFPGDPSRGQSSVHLDDVVDAIGSCIERRAALSSETTLLIGEPDVVSYAELQRALGRLIHGHDWRTWRVPKPLAKAGAFLQNHLPLARDSFIKPWMIDFADDHYAVDVTRAKKTLGWQPQHQLAGSLPAMVETLRADANAWYRRNHIDPPRLRGRKLTAPRSSSTPALPATR